MVASDYSWHSLGAVLLLASKEPFQNEAPALHEATGFTGIAGLPRRFWLYAVLVLLYGVVETLNGNWATIYLGGKPEQYVGWSCPCRDEYVLLCRRQ